MKILKNKQLNAESYSVFSIKSKNKRHLSLQKKSIQAYNRPTTYLPSFFTSIQTNNDSFKDSPPHFLIISIYLHIHYRAWVASQQLNNISFQLIKFSWKALEWASSTILLACLHLEYPTFTFNFSSTSILMSFIL